MQRIKFTSKTTAKTSEGLKYKGYAVGELPPTFAFVYNENKETHGITQWFNYKGLLCYILRKFYNLRLSDLQVLHLYIYISYCLFIILSKDYCVLFVIESR